MNVMLCGANDMKLIDQQFDNVVQKFGFTPLYFTRGKIEYSNYQSWKENSTLSVQSADILVYVILEKHGAITWDVEFSTAKNLGKPFIILCLDETYNFYTGAASKKGVEIDPASALGAIVKLLSQLDTEQRTPIPFQYGSFDEVLHQQLLQTLRHGVKALQQQNQKTVMVNLVKANLPNALKKQSFSPQDLLYIKEIMFDPFENKELRKRILDYFLDIKTLSETEVTDLINDHEQGVSRKAVANLAGLVTPEMDTRVIFGTVVEACNNNDDIGLINRAIPSLLSIDLKQAVKYLVNLFPQKNATPSERIILWFDKNKELVDGLRSSDPSFKADFEKLLTTCLDFNRSTGDWREIAKRWLNGEENNPSS